MCQAEEELFCYGGIHKFSVWLSARPPIDDWSGGASILASERLCSVVNAFAPLAITPPALMAPLPRLHAWPAPHGTPSPVLHRAFDRPWRHPSQEHASFVAPGAAPLPVAVRTCPATLGVRCGGSGDGAAEDEATSIISKGCILPAQGTTTVKLGGAGGGGPPTEAYLEVVEIKQAGGEGAPSTARLLGTLAFDEAVVSADGSVVEVKVGFTLRSEGVLKVEAVAPGGASKVLVIDHDGATSS